MRTGDHPGVWGGGGGVLNLADDGLPVLGS